MAEFAAYQPEEPRLAQRAPIRVRAAVADDIPRLASIESDREGTDVDRAAEGLGRLIERAASGQALLFAAEYEGAVVGLAKASHFLPPESSPANIAPEGWYLSGIVVSPHARRRGVGAALTAARLDWFDERHVRYVYYIANARNQVSIDLHHTFGFLERTRDFTHPQIQFEGGAGILFARDSARMQGVVRRVDHLVYATPDLEASAEMIERLLGAQPSVGGRHLGRGTRNMLLTISPAAYLELLGPDPEQPAPTTPRWFGIDELRAGRLVRWAAHSSDVAALAKRAKERSLDLGNVENGHRQAADGQTLSWTFTNPMIVVEDGIVPFFIDWRASPHPSATAARGPSLVNLRAEHPTPERVRGSLEKLRLALPVAHGTAPALIALFKTENGYVELR